MSGAAPAWRAELPDVAAALSAPSHEGGPAVGDLPLRGVLARVVEELRIAFFAEQLGPGGFSPDRRLSFVQSTLDSALRGLQAQVSREPALPVDPAELVTAFVHQLPGIQSALCGDLAAALAGDPAARSTTEILLCYPGFTAVLHHRIAHALHGLGAPLVARSIAEIGHSVTAVDIHPGAVIGERLFIDHGTGVVIGETAILGRNIRLYQGVTLGAKSFPTDGQGQVIRGAPRHPILEDDVQVYAGATLLGRITIGRGSIIGGGVWLTHSVPPQSRVVQAPHRAETFTAGAGI